MQTGFDYTPFISGGNQEDSIIELLNRSENLPIFCGVNFSPKLWDQPIGKIFSEMAFDLRSDYEYVLAQGKKTIAGLPKDKERILLQADKATAATLWQIETLRSLNPNASIWVIGSNKSGIKGQQKKIERTMGPTQTHNIAASSRIFEIYGENPPKPEVFKSDYLIDGIAKPFVTLPGVFSQKRLDPGTSLLLESMKKIDLKDQSVFDLGSGCGIIGIQALLNGASSLISSDLSMQAQQNTLLQFENFGFAKSQAQAFWSCADSQIEVSEFDWILTNPPYHLKSDMRTDYPKFWSQVCHRRLRSGGKLLLVCNRFLPYLKKLPELFEKVELINESKEYLVVLATK